MIANHIMNILYENWAFLLSSLQQDWLSRRNLEIFADVIHQKGAPLDNCWGFVDGTTRPKADLDNIKECFIMVTRDTIVLNFSRLWRPMD